MDALTIDTADLTPAPWLWPSRIPAGRLTLLDAMPGTGKTTIAASVAASVSAGAKWLDGQPAPERGTVLWLGYEDDPGVVAGRITAAGGDPSRVVMLSKGAGGKPLLFPRDIQQLEEIVAAVNPKLIVIDPIAGFVDLRGTDSSVRSKLMPLLELAQASGAAVLALRHPTKGSMAGSGPALYAGGGSIAIAAVARSAMVMARDPYGDLVIASSKSSLAVSPASIDVVIFQAINGHPYLACAGESPYQNGDDLMSAVRAGRENLGSRKSSHGSKERIASLRAAIGSAAAPVSPSSFAEDYLASIAAAAVRQR